MSLLNQASDGISSILIVIFKLLSYEKRKLTRENIVNLCAPGGAFSQARVRQTLNTWRDLGMFEETETAVTFHSDVRRDERNIESLPTLARRLVLCGENNRDLWASEEALSADFTRAMCWLLAQDVWAVETSGWDDAELLLQKQTQDSKEWIQNDTRWNGLKTWARFLGFGWTSGKSTFVVDPTEAVRVALPRVFGKKKTMAATDFIPALAENLPVLDGGPYREEIELRLAEKTGPDAWRPPPKGQISTSLSRALSRMIGSGILSIETRADAEFEHIQMTGRNGTALSKPISHLTFHQL